MLNNFIDYPQKCTTCGNLKTFPYTWNSTIQPVMCTCKKEQSLAWECPRCKKMNAPWKGSCDCTPSTLSSSPTCGVQLDKFSVDEIGQWEHPYVGGANPFNAYFPDPNRNINQDHIDKQ